MAITIENIDELLKAIAAAAKIGSSFGIPFTGLASTLIPIFNEMIDEIAARAGKTREEIIALTSATLSDELVALLASDAKGE